MRLSDVQHQPRAISILRRSLSSGRTHHAYLFEGPEGVGKQMAAKGARGPAAVFVAGHSGGRRRVRELRFVPAAGAWQSSGLSPD